MDDRMKERIRNGSLSKRDVRQIIDWQLTLDERKIDSQLISECLFLLYPEDFVLNSGEKAALWNRIRHAAWGDSRVRRAKAQHRRRGSAKMILIALMITLLLAGVAIAATLGLFGYFISDPYTEMSHQRLEYLDEVAVNVGETVQVAAPAGDLSQIDLTTDYGRILAQQFSRRFELTVDQVYCDGNKLYYSYRLSEPQHTFELLEGIPTGFDKWDWEEPGKKLADTFWTPGFTAEEKEQAAAWFLDHECAYAIESSFGLGDGAWLDDGSERGRSLNIFDSGMEEPDPYTEIGFQQVDLPQDYVPGDTISFFLHVSYRVQVIRQDEMGVYRTSVENLENRGFIPVRFTAKVTGKPDEYVKCVEFEEYAAEVHLAVSDVDISGEVRIDPPQAWVEAWNNMDLTGEETENWVRSYTLIADGQQMRNVGGGYGIGLHSDCWTVDFRYDLPVSCESIVLVPERKGLGLVMEESIVIR